MLSKFAYDTVLVSYCHQHNAVRQMQQLIQADDYLHVMYHISSPDKHNKDLTHLLTNNACFR